MPGITVHSTLARSTLEDRRRRACAPFDVHDPATRNPFLHGAVGPDLGYFPGGSREPSDLDHCLRSGRLSRSLLGTASTPRERAHGVGDLVHGDRERFVDGSSDLRASGAGLPEPGLRSHVPRRLRAGALRAFPPRHRHPGGQALSTLLLVRGLMGEGLLLRPLGRTLRVICRTGAVHHVSPAHVIPVQPSPWLLEAVRQEGLRHADRMRQARETDGAPIKDWNPDTGRLLETQDSHSGTRRAVEALVARPSLPPAEA